MHHIILNKEELNNLLSALARQQKVVAPIAKGSGQFIFSEVSSAQGVSLKHRPTILPPKKYFIPARETLATFDTSQGQVMQPVVESERLLLFGVHTCDLAGIQCLNMVFSEQPEDLNYLTRQNKITIIGLECNEYCDEHASCRLVHNHLPNGGYDLFMTDLGDRFIVHVNTRAGEEVANQIKVFKGATPRDRQALEAVREKKRQIFANEVPVVHERIPEMLARSYHSKIWKELGSQCLACGNCTNVCPTCYCFDVIDEPNLDLLTGQRYRRWDSCQSETFAQVAGGENFREERGARQRHRYHRKFKYPMDKFSRLFCTGCGRCSRTCMARINLKETLTKLAEEQGILDATAGRG